MYRILRDQHHFAHRRLGGSMYPTYDWAHGQSDAIEGTTATRCAPSSSDSHRPLYDWYMDNVGARWRRDPASTEFARLNLTHTVMSEAQAARSWSRRAMSTDGTTRGCRPSRVCVAAAYPAAAIREFCRPHRHRQASTAPIEIRTAFRIVRARAPSQRQRACGYMVVLRPARGRDRPTTPTKVEEDTRDGDQQSRRTIRAPASVKVPFSPASCSSSATTSCSHPPKPSFSVSPPAGRFGCATGYFITCNDVVRDRSRWRDHPNSVVHATIPADGRRPAHPTAAR